MKTTSIGFTVQLIENDLSPNERFPVLDCFLDARWERDPVRVKLLNQPQKVVLTGKLDRNTRTLPISAGMGFASWAWRKNDDDNFCLVDTGVNQLYLGYISQKLKKNGEFSVDFPLIMNTVQQLKKGVLRVTFNANDFDVCNIPIEMNISASIASIGSRMNGYINETMQTEQAMPETLPGTERMRIPFNYSESGMQSTGGEPLPAASYVLAEIPKDNTLFWENVHNMVMDRDGSTWEHLTLEGKARATVLTICYTAQYLDYIPDKVDRNMQKSKALKPLEPCENFGNAGATWSGDCEDLAMLETQCRNALRRHTFPPGQKYDKFREMQRIVENYMNPMTLAAVNGMQVRDQEAQLGAHMNNTFIPIEMFIGEMNKTREGREMLKTLPLPKDDEIIKGLPLMIGEGTGMYEPLGFKNPRLSVMSYVYQAPSLSFAKKPIENERHPADDDEQHPDDVEKKKSFFEAMLTLITDYFSQRGAPTPLSFWACTEQPNGTLTRGAKYTDMINHPERVAFRPQQNIPIPVMGLVNEAIKMRVPPRPLVLTEMEAHKKNHHLEKLCKAVADFKRKQGDPRDNAPVYIRPHQLSDKRIDRMISDFQRLRNVCKVDYKLERITDEIWGYRMNVYVNREH